GLGDLPAAVLIESEARVLLSRGVAGAPAGGVRAGALAAGRASASAGAVAARVPTCGVRARGVPAGAVPTGSAPAGSVSTRSVSTARVATGIASARGLVLRRAGARVPAGFAARGPLALLAEVDGDPVAGGQGQGGGDSADCDCGPHDRRGAHRSLLMALWLCCCSVRLHASSSHSSEEPFGVRILCRLLRFRNIPSACARGAPRIEPTGSLALALALPPVAHERAELPVEAALAQQPPPQAADGLRIRGHPDPQVRALSSLLPEDAGLRRRRVVLGRDGSDRRGPGRRGLGRLR